jgi:ADP-ribose pyrophosphatase YjhB (NUDIX family)
MIEFVSINHHIQKHIIDVLMYQEKARFRDLKPPRVDTNLFSYHLKLLQKASIVQKDDTGYSLAQRGMSYVDRVSSEKRTIRTQPKIVTMLLVQNGDGDVLLQKRTKQPYIGTWTLPYGKLHIEDGSVEAAGRREAFEKLGLDNQPLRHTGDCYIRVTMADGAMLSSTLVHVCTFNRDDIVTSDTIQWARPHKLRDYKLAPAVEEIVTRGFFHDPFFFEEFTLQLED